MALIKGGFQRIFQTFLYALLFLCNAVILGIFSYFLSVLADRNLRIPTWEKAVEGMSGAAIVYLIFAVVLTCCLGGIAFLAFLAIVLDVAFAACMIAIAVLTRDGASSCKGQVQTPLGEGQASQHSGAFGKAGFGLGSDDNATYAVSLGTACKLNTAVFACAILAALLFLCTAAMQVLLVRHHKKEKRYGPSPSNNYTSGYGKSRFGFGRKKNNTTKAEEAGTLSSPTNNRVSHETGYTGTTVGGNTGHTTTSGGLVHDSYADGYGKTEPRPMSGTHGAYYTAPTGTATQNPYGYNSHNTATNY